MRVYAKNRVEIHGKKVRPLRSGNQDGGWGSGKGINAVSVDGNASVGEGASFMGSLDGRTLREESMRDSSGEKDAVISARNSAMEGTALKRMSTAKETVGFVDTVDAGGGVGGQTVQSSMATTVRSFFAT